MKKITGLFISLVLVVAFIVSHGCGSSSSSSTVTDNVSAMSTLPSSDPSTMDYANATSLSEMKADHKNRSENRPPGGTTYIKLSSSVASDGTRTMNVFQCSGSTFVGSATYTILNDKYTGSSRFRFGSGTYKTDLTMVKKVGVAITDSSFVGNVDMNIYSNSETAHVIVSADGSTKINKLTGAKSSKAMACAWNSTLGCAKLSGASAVPYAISVNSSTNAKTFSSSSDQTLCSSLPDFTTLGSAPSAITTGDTYWDCSLPSGSSWIELTKSNSALEDAGGLSCKTATDAFESKDSSISSCGAGGDVTSVGCYCDGLYTFAVKEARRQFRALECKAKGIFKLIQSGSVTGVTFSDGGTIYIKNTEG